MSRKIFSTNIGKITIFTTSLILIGMITMGSTYAFYHQETEVLTNTFTVGEITTEIIEEFDANGTKSPKVTNTDVTDCIVRMRYDISPSNAPIKDLVINPEWEKKSDGFYYYKGLLKSRDSNSNITTPLFNNYEIKKDTEDEKEQLKEFINDYGRGFQIILYQEAVQAEMVDNEGTTIKAFDENGDYVWSDHAQKIWECYDMKNNP